MAQLNRIAAPPPGTGAADSLRSMRQEGDQRCFTACTLWWTDACRAAGELANSALACRTGQRYAAREVSHGHLEDV
jgi:hypothetical protein